MSRPWLAEGSRGSRLGALPRLKETWRGPCQDPRAAWRKRSLRAWSIYPSSLPKWGQPCSPRALHRPRRHPSPRLARRRPESRKATMASPCPAPLLLLSARLHSPPLRRMWCGCRSRHQTAPRQQRAAQRPQPTTRRWLRPYLPCLRTRPLGSPGQAGPRPSRKPKARVHRSEEAATPKGQKPRGRWWVQEAVVKRRGSAKMGVRRETWNMWPVPWERCAFRRLSVRHATGQPRASARGAILWCTATNTARPATGSSIRSFAWRALKTHLRR
mmetsp:Transcript_5263/g.15454  ORF Transcript_5263/g.15454 Transcript_5263/m.15454 type:complete len:272 (+) Transcript_5263:400-1215(+)